MTPATLQIVLLVLGCVLLSMSAAKRLPIPYPALLVLVGLLVSLVPGLSSLSVEPDLVFFVFLPPVLWAAAYLTSWRDFRNNARPITQLAVALVLATTAAVALCAHSLIQGLGWRKLLRSARSCRRPMPCLRSPWLAGLACRAGW
jgi:CPA1 family monovalent cation:H+ antiporter